ncbi:MAG: aspartate/glutamate racemase family protein [Spirochaetia bacterium]|jgi:Asp/Glu/hydantoin racemase|nr:aspartate/glutamate racemase family protein [Spirochaetia bacterium]
MKYNVKSGQVSYGEAVGILLIQNYVPFVPGDVANATTYDYPVRFQRVPGLSVERIFSHDMTFYTEIKTAAESLVKEGVRAITGDCGFLALFQKQLAEDLEVPVFMSSLLQIPFILSIIAQTKKLGVVTANSESLDIGVFNALGITESQMDRIVIAGLENSEHFVSAVIKEEGVLDTDLMEKETVEAALLLQKENPGLGAILLECSLLPPYGKAVQEATGLPVFDFVTLIDYVFSAVVKKQYYGFM